MVKKQKYYNRGDNNTVIDNLENIDMNTDEIEAKLDTLNTTLGNPRQEDGHGSTSGNPSYAEITNPGAIGGGTEYTEGDIDSSITGSAIMWEDTADTLRAVSAAKPLPIDVISSALPTGAATSANQSTIIGHVDGIETTLTSLDGKDYATETTLSAVKTAVETLDNIVSGSEAQVDIVEMPQDVTSSGIITANGQTLNPTMMNGVSTIGFQITGTWTGQLEFEATVDGTNFVAIRARDEANDDGSNSTTSNGVFAVPVGGMQAFRVRSSSWTSGTASIFFRSSIAAQTVQISSPLPTGTNSIGAVTVSGVATESEQQTQTTHLSALETSTDVIESNTNNRYSGGKTAATATVTASGDTTVITPAAGNAIRVFWVSAINDPDETTTPLIKVKIGSTEIYRGYAIAHWEIFAGAADETVVVNLSGLVVNGVAVTIHYEEFTP